MLFAKQWFVILALVGVMLMSGCSRGGNNTAGEPVTVTTSDGITLTLGIPDFTLPQGVSKSAVHGTALSVFEPTEKTKYLSENDIVLALIRLEPEGIEFSEPVKFALSFESEREVRPRVFNINNKGSEEITDFKAEFDSQKKSMVITGYLTHFSELAATKDKSQESYSEFARRSRDHIDYLKEKISQQTYYTEKAKYYHYLADAAKKYAGEELDWPDDEIKEHLRRRLDLIAKYEQEGLSNDEAIERASELIAPLTDFDGIAGQALTQYAKNTVQDYDFRINQEKDPFKRFDLVKERLKLTFDIYGEMQNPLFDERAVLPLGRDALGESRLLRDQSDSIITQVAGLIDAEQDSQKREALITRLEEIAGWFGKESQSAAYDERRVPYIGKWDKLLKKYGTSIREPATTPACTWTCSAWSECLPPGTQTRTCSSSPDSCIGANPNPTSQGCTPLIPECTWTCGPWSDCPASGIQTRTCTSSPIPCLGANPNPTTQACTPSCIWTCGPWSDCPASGIQTRTCSSSPDPCIGANPNPISRGCTPPATCDRNALGSCLSENCVTVYGPGGSANCPERCRQGDVYDENCLATQCNGPYQECLSACRDSNPPCTMDDVYAVLG